MKDTNFFNRESVQYSKKRYSKKVESYLQAFFARRLALTKKFLGIVLPPEGKVTLLEVGCADGVILRELQSTFPLSFTSLVGIDIASDMIDTASKLNLDVNTSFFLRTRYIPTQHDIIVETGVVNYAHVDEEIKFASENLKLGGWYILSIAGTDSLYNRIKRDSLSDFRMYAEYEPILKKYFTVKAVRGVGFFIPLIWRVPLLARPIQAIAEIVFGSILPGWCHEKLYLLQKHA